MADTRASAVNREALEEALGAWPPVEWLPAGLVVPTHCLYGSNAIVRVTVEAGLSGCKVHDDGGAIDEFSSSGGEILGAVKLVKNFVRESGLTVTATGAIVAPRALISDLAPTIAIVANASKEASAMLHDRWKPRIKRDFRGDLQRLLEREFPQRMLEPETRLEGSSLKQHRFDFAVPIDGGRLVVDAVAHEQSAISASVLKSLDVTKAQLPGVVLRVVYDDRDEWRAEDLNLLGLGAVPIAFTRAQEALHRLAA